MPRSGLKGLIIRFSGVLGNCPLVQAPQWGTVRERVLKDGTLQTVYSCEPGRRLKGHKILTCTADGWNHPIPKCVPYGKLRGDLDSGNIDPDSNLIQAILFPDRHTRQYQLQQLREQQQRRSSGTDHVSSPSTHYGRGRVETRILPRRKCCA
ncbi:hypothetical protein ANTPLA_LOCUS4443, partial [Anthophora plagiata]